MSLSWEKQSISKWILKEPTEGEVGKSSGQPWKIPDVVKVFVVLVSV